MTAAQIQTEIRVCRAQAAQCAERAAVEICAQERAYLLAQAARYLARAISRAQLEQSR